MEKMRLLFGLAFVIGFLGPVSVSGGRHLVGSAKCTWGPSYWCRGLKESNKCGATRHCINTLWNSNPYPSDDDEVCKICKEMVKEARDQLLSNETQTELKEVFEGSCALIPIKIIANECKKLADDFVVELVETLASEMNPDTVCTVAGLCNSRRIDKLLELYHSERKIESGCDVCNRQMGTLASRIRAMDKGTLLDKGLELCGQHMSSYSDACKRALLENFDDIYGALEKIDDGSICAATDLCQDGATLMVSARKGDDLECEFCEKVVQHWITEWSSNVTQQEFKTALETICKHLRNPDRVSRCLHIVDDYYLPLFNYILQSLNSHTICQAVGLCGNSGLLQGLPDAPISVLKPFDYNIPAVASIQRTELVGGYFSPAFIHESKPTCVLCEFVMHRLAEFLNDGKTQDEIENGLHQVCGYMPPSVKPDCDDFVDTYGPQLVQLIIQEVHSNDICKMLGLCDEELRGAMATWDALAIESDSPFALAKKKSEGCTTCQFVAHIILEQVRDPDNQEEIRNVVQSMCRLFPESIEFKCDDFVGQYAESLIRLVADGLTEDEICEGLDLCEKPEPENGVCVLCEFVITKVKEIIKDKSDREEIKEELEMFCTHLPKSISPECKQFVDTYTDMIMDLIEQELDPDQVCTSLGLCVNKSVAQAVSHVIEDLEEGNLPKDGICVLCEYVINQLKEILGDKTDKEAVKKELEVVCGTLPSSISKECKDFVDQYSDLIVDLINQELDPDQVCKALRLCATASEAVSNTAEIEFSEVEIYGGPDRVDGSLLCMPCEYVFGELDKALTDPKNVEQFKEVLETLCDDLSAPVKNYCEDLVENHSDEIVDMLVKEFTPAEMCANLGLCDPPKRTSLDQPIIDNEITVQDLSLEDSSEEVEMGGGPLCALCEFGMNVLEKKILTNRTMDMVEHAVLMLCSYMPQTIEDECEKLVQEYGDAIIHLIVDAEMSPEEVCSALGVCAAAGSTGDTPRVGRCIWGRSMWCASRVHAEACGTEEYCRRRGFAWDY